MTTHNNQIKITILLKKGLIKGEGSMRKRLIALAIMLAVQILLMSSTVQAASVKPTFTDIQNSPYKQEIIRWSQNGIVAGMTETTFDEKGTLTRAQLASYIVRLLGLKTTSQNTFSDLTADKWYYSDVLKANAAGILQGSGTEIWPERAVNRAEAVSILSRVARVLASSVNAYPRELIPEWALGSVNGMAQRGFLKGLFTDGFNAAKYMTRGEMVKLIDNCVPNYLNAPGTYKSNNISAGDVYISSGNITLSDVTVHDNVFITQKVGTGAVTLDNVRVSDALYVDGGGDTAVKLTGNSSAGRILDSRPNGVVQMPANQPSNNLYSISGKVIASDTKAGLRATVTLKDNLGRIVGTSIATNSDGTFNFIGIPSGTGYTVTATSDKYSTGTTGSINLSNHVSGITLTLTGNSNNFTISGTVTNASGKVPNATVTLQASSDKSIIHTATTGTDGTYHLTNIPEGSYSLSATSGSMTAANINLNVNKDIVQNLTIINQSSSSNPSNTNTISVSGSVFSVLSMGPESDVKVTLVDSSGTDTGYTTVTDSKGNYTLEDVSVASGAYKIKAEVSGKVIYSDMFSIQGNDVTRIRVTLPADVPVGGKQ